MLITLLVETGLRVRKEALPLRWQDMLLDSVALLVPSPISRLIFSTIDWWQNLNFFCDPQGHKAYESVSFFILITSLRLSV
jgi:hypothetical protein